MAVIVRRALNERWTTSRQDVKETLANERLRREQLQACLLQNDKVLLEIQGLSDTQLISSLLSASLRVRSMLHKTKRDLDHSRNDVRSYEQDFDVLKTHLLGRNERHRSTATAASTDDPVLQNNGLPSILRHINELHWQTESHKQTLSEKLALQRQLTTVEIELETERNQRAEVSAKLAASAANEAMLEARVCSLESMPKNKSQRPVAPTEVGKESLEFSSTIRKQHRCADGAADSSVNALKSPLQGAASLQAIDFTTKPHRTTVGFENADDRIEYPFHKVADRRDTRNLLANLGAQSTFSTTPFVKKIENRVDPLTDLLPHAVVEQNVHSSKPPTQSSTYGKHHGVSNTSNTDATRGTLRLANDVQAHVLNHSRLKGAHANATRGDDIGGLSRDESLVWNVKGKSTVVNPAETKRMQIKRKRTTAGLIGAEAPGRKRRILGGGSGGSILDDDEEDIHIVKNNIRRFEPKADSVNELADLRLERRLAHGFIHRGGFSPRKRDKKIT